MRTGPLLLTLATASLAACGRIGFGDPSRGSDDAARAIDARSPRDAGRGPYEIAVLASNPSAYYRLEETTIGTAVDDTGHGYDGTYLLQGGVVDLGRVGALTGQADRAVELFGDATAGKSGSVQLPPSMTALWAGDFTIEAFVHPTSSPPVKYADAMVLCEHYMLDGFRTGWDDTYHLRFWTDEAGGGSVILAATAFDPTVFNHVAFVHSGGDALVYLNGAVVAQDVFNWIPPDSMADCGFGAFHGMASHADLDELAVYTRALPPAELAAHLAADH